MCLCSSSEDSNRRPPGTPGTPGSRDLEAALRRLSLRRDNYLSEKRFLDEERERKLAYLAKEEEKEGGEGSGGPGTPTESLLSLCTHPSLGSIWSGYSYAARSYLPEKLQIVKPLEGDHLSYAVFKSPNTEKENNNHNVQKSLNSEQNRAQNTTQNPNDNIPQSSLQSHSDSSQSRTDNHSQCHQHNQYVIFHNNSRSKILMRAMSLHGSCSSLEQGSLKNSQPLVRTPLTLLTGLLEVLGQHGGSLNPQHSFYFRHTQPRCWFEI